MQVSKTGWGTATFTLCSAAQKPCADIGRRHCLETRFRCLRIDARHCTRALVPLRARCAIGLLTCINESGQSCDSVPARCQLRTRGIRLCYAPGGTRVRLHAKSDSIRIEASRRRDSRHSRHRMTRIVRGRCPESNLARGPLARSSRAITPTPCTSPMLDCIRRLRLGSCGRKKGRRAPAFFETPSDYLFVDSPLTSTSTRRFGARHSISAFWFF